MSSECVGGGGGGDTCISLREVCELQCVANVGGGDTHVHVCMCVGGEGGESQAQTQQIASN